MVCIGTFSLRLTTNSADCFSVLNCLTVTVRSLIVAVWQVLSVHPEEEGTLKGTPKGTPKETPEEIRLYYVHRFAFQRSSAKTLKRVYKIR